MTGYLLAALGSIGTFIVMAALGDMVSEEVRDRLDHLPHAILRLAARRLDPGQRAAIYEEVWLPDLAYFLKGDEARPVTRLIQGTRFAIGILTKARRIERNLSLAAQYQPTAKDTDDGIDITWVPDPAKPGEWWLGQAKVQLYVDGSTRLSAIRSFIDRCVLDNPDREG